MIEFLIKGLMMCVLVTVYLATAYVCFGLVINTIKNYRRRKYFEMMVQERRERWRKNVRKEKE